MCGSNRTEGNSRLFSTPLSKFVADVPGNFIVVDHALSRMNKGAWAIIEVEGEDRPDLYRTIE